MSVSRDDLEQDRIRERLRDSRIAPLLLTDAQLEASLQSTLQALAPDADPWLFTYGSLIWNPLFHFAERRVALLHGYHRAFCLHSRINRGTPERPGLVLALDRGGACHGVAYRVPRAQAEDEFRVIWRREMMLGSYQPHWVAVRSGGERIRAVAFVVDRTSSGYAGKLAPEAIVETLLGASGFYGSGADYLLRTVEGLEASGIRDPQLHRLRELLLARRPDLAQAGEMGTAPGTAA